MTETQPKFQLIGRRIGRISVAVQPISETERKMIWDFRDGFFLVEHLKHDNDGIEQRINCEWLTRPELEEKGFDYREEA